MNRPAIQDGPSTLARGLSLLDHFSASDNELSINELSRRSGTPKSTTHRLVAVLLEWGALEQGATGVRLGVRLFELGSIVPVQRRLRDLAIPFAHNLNEVTQLTSNVAIRDGQEIVYVEKVISRSLRVPHSREGGRLPLHCTALGKAILAHSDPAFVESVLSGELKAVAPRTITNPSVLRTEFAHIRQTKIAYDVEESQPGLFCVASPIFAGQHEVVGAISVTGATALSQAQRFAPTVKTTALALSHALGSHYDARPLAHTA